MLQLSLGQTPAKGSLLGLPGLASPSFPLAPNSFCAVFQIHTGNASQLGGLSKFHYYLLVFVCQDGKILHKASPKSALDEFHIKIVHQMFFFQHDHRN